MHFSDLKSLNVNLDRHINPYLGPPKINRLPRWIAHILGYRDKTQKEIGNVLVSCWAFLGAFCGVAVIEAFFMIPAISRHGTPLIVASFGAAAILEYNTIESPLSQPRNSIIGHFIAAVTGVGVTKLFTLSPRFEEIRWLAGALACGLASAVMGLTKTVHPPAGATALLAAVDPKISRLGWFLLPLVLLSSVMTLVTSLIINNIQRQFPLFWWTAANLERPAPDIEKVPTFKTDIERKKSEHDERQRPAYMITIAPNKITVPEHICLADVEKVVLEDVRNRLQEGSDKYVAANLESNNTSRTEIDRAT